MTIRGVVGSVRWGYHRAADVRSWVVSRHPTTKVWTLRAVVVRADPFLGARSELHFVAPLKGGRAWQWPIRELRMGGGTLAAQLGPVEATGGAPTIATREGVSLA